MQTKALTRRAVALGALLAVLSLLAGAAPSWAQDEQTESVRGVLRFEGEPIDGVRITVESAEGDDVGDDITDADGRWEVPVPGAGTYILTLDVSTLPSEVPGVESETIETTVNNTQQKAVLFVLGVSEQGGDAGVSSDNGTSVDRVLQLAVEGLRFGVVLALAALGLSMIFGTTGLTNFSHGELVTFGAIVAWYLNDLGLPFIAATALAVTIGGVFGLAQDTVLWRPLRDRKTGLIAMMIVSIGLAVFLRYTYLYIFSGSRRSYREYTIQTGIEIGPVTLAPRDMVSMVVSIAVIALVVWALSGTRLGKATRAVADNPALASASGIDVNQVIRVVWIGGAALAALGGVFIGLSQQVDYQMGFRTLLLVFAAVILGGLGTVSGAIVGALLVGLFIQLSTLVIPIELQNAGVLGLLIVVLLLRPQGILGRRERVG